MKELVAIILLQFGVSFSYGQSLNVIGSIKEMGSNESVPFANITFHSANDSIELQADIDGHFSINSVKADYYRISVRSITFSPLDTTIHISKQNRQIKFELVWKQTDTLFIGANAEGAKYNIAKDRLYLYLPGGIGGTERLETDSIFESNYKVYYLRYGCLKLGDDNYSEYNQVMFQYLDNKYGEIWRSEVRKDVIGLIHK